MSKYVLKIGHHSHPKMAHFFVSAACHTPLATATTLPTPHPKWAGIRKLPPNKSNKFSKLMEIFEEIDNIKCRSVLPLH